MVFTIITPPEERFRSKYIVKDSGCWEWQGANNGNGYGVFWDYDLGRNDGAHRVSYRLHVGPIPGGFEIDHLCQNTLCVNPAHLEPVTGAENKRRAKMRKTHCPSGHPYDAENTRVSARGSRYCRACDREGKRAETYVAVEDRTHCGKGHEWTTENTYHDGRGYRYCRECRRINGKKWWARQKDVVSPSKEVDNVRAQEDTGTTTEQGSKA